MTTGLYLLRIGDGTAGVTFTSDPHAVLEYVPLTASDGAPAGPAVRVSETLRVAVADDSFADALAWRDLLARYLAQAERAAGGSGEAKIYVECQRASTLPVWRAQIVRGRVGELEDEGYFPARGVVRLSVHIERLAYWEGPLTELPLATAALMVPAVGGLAVFNGKVGTGAADWVGISGANVVGDLPAPLVLQWTNASAGVTVERLDVGLHTAAHNAGGLLTVTQRLEAGDATAGVGSGVGHTVTDAGDSGGSAQQVPWSGATEARGLVWPLSSAQLALAGGRWFRAFVRLVPAASVTGLLVQARVTLGLGQTIYAGPWVAPSTAHELCDLGVVPLPPVSGPVAGMTTMYLELYVKAPGSGAKSVVVDYVALLGLEGLRRYEAAMGVLLAQGDWLTDDAVNGELYVSTELGGVGAVMGYWLCDGDALYVRPGCDAWLVGHWEDDDGAAVASWTATVRAWYRARVVVP